MYTIVMQNDKSLITTKRVKIHQRETNVDEIRILVPSTYTEGAEEYDFSIYIVAAKIKCPDGKIYCKQITYREELYKEHLDFRVKVDTDLTAVAGTVELYLTFLKVYENEDGTTTEHVLHTSTAYIEIEPKKEYIFIPDKTLQAVDQLLLQIDEKINQLNSANGGTGDSTTEADDIAIIDGKIFLVKTDPITGEKTPIGDGISGTSHVWSGM